MNVKTIFIVEANQQLRAFLFNTFSAEGYSVLAADNETEAIDLILGLASVNPVDYILYGLGTEHQTHYTSIILKKLCLMKFGQAPKQLSFIDQLSYSHRHEKQVI